LHSHFLWLTNSELHTLHFFTRQQVPSNTTSLTSASTNLRLTRFQVAGVDPTVVTPVDLLALVAEEAAHVGAEVSGDSVVVAGEARWLRRLARNLLENARRHSGGQHVRAHVTSQDAVAWLSVDDDGAGVPMQLRERIFEPFFRPQGMRESHAKGVGLGLALVRQIARRHSGDARCESAPAGGSRFLVSLRGVTEAAPHHIKSSGT
jgi:signal transduction histidine kinase